VTNKLLLIILFAVTGMYAADNFTAPAGMFAADTKEIEAKRQEKFLKYMEFMLAHQAPAKTPEEQYQEELQTYPMLRLTNEINDVIIHDEAKRVDKTSMQTRIDAEYKKFEASERTRCTEVMRFFKIPIERTFQEYEYNSDPLAHFVIGGIKRYEETKKQDDWLFSAWGFSIIYEWKKDNDGNRLLWCLIQADPKDIMAAYDKQ